jgi:hypothetical protein
MHIIILPSDADEETPLNNKELIIRHLSLSGDSNSLIGET